MKIILSLLLICLAALVSCGVTGSGKEKTPPDILGKIVFSANDKSGVPQIYTIKANGTHLKQLTHFSRHSNRSGIEPAWSPDGSRIAFASYSGTTLGTYLMVMGADGSNMRLLKRYKKGSLKGMIGAWPSWSPDGSKIAFQVCTNCEIGGSNYEISYVAVKGKYYAPGQVHDVTNSPYSDMFPAWSPDSKKIVFASDRDYINADTLRFRQDLYVINTDGTHLQRLTTSGNVSIPRWSPIGGYIAYAWQSINPNIYLLNLKLDKVKKITNLKFVGRPSWSQDGSKLLIPATTNRGKSVIQIISKRGTILETFKLSFNSLKDSRDFDWYSGQ
jgi:TolB protein